MALLVTPSRLLAVFSFLALFSVSIAQDHGNTCAKGTQVTLTFDEIINSAANGRQEISNPWTYPNQPFTFTQPPVPSWWETSVFQLINKNAIQPPTDFRAVACSSSSPNCFEARYPAPTLEISVVSTPDCPRPLFDVISFRYYTCPVDSREFNITTYDSNNNLLTKIQKPPHEPDNFDRALTFKPRGGDKAWEKLGKLVLSVGSQPFRTGGRCGDSSGLYVDDLKFKLRCNC